MFSKLNLDLIQVRQGVLDVEGGLWEGGERHAACQSRVDGEIAAQDCGSA